MKLVHRYFILLITSAGLTGCGNPPKPSQSVDELVVHRVGLQVQHAGEQPQSVRDVIAQLIARPLSAESASRIALLNNRELAVQLEEVGIAEADYIAAGQIKNPAIYADFRPPDRRPPSGVDIEASITEDVLDILLLPLRKRIAQQQLDRVAVLSADVALQLVLDVRVAFYGMVTHGQDLKLQQQLNAAAEASADFARRQHDAGNINDLDWANQQANYSETQIQTIHAEAILSADREKLNRLLGLTGDQTHWTAVDSLDAIPDQDPAEQIDFETAAAQRLDIAAASGQVLLAEQALTYTQKGLLTEVRVGASLEHQTDHQTVVGPSLSLELPIFNQHQGQIARAEAEIRQAKRKRDASRVQMEAELRLAAAQVRQARSAATLAEKSLLPQRKAVTAAAQLQYNGMLIGIYALLAAKQNELLSAREALESRQDYWVARAQLDRASGK